MHPANADAKRSTAPRSGPPRGPLKNRHPMIHGSQGRCWQTRRDHDHDGQPWIGRQGLGRQELSHHWPQLLPIPFITTVRATLDPAITHAVVIRPVRSRANSIHNAIASSQEERGQRDWEEHNPSHRRESSCSVRPNERPQRSSTPRPLRDMRPLSESLA
jgi:hypothetical protein